VRGGYLQLRRGLFEHVTDGRMSLTECSLYVAIMAHAKPDTGIWKGSAGLLASLYGLSPRTARDVLEKLELKHYIKRFPVPGSHSSYPILVNKYECSDGAVKGMRLNTEKTTDYTVPVYESCEDDGKRGVKHSAGTKRMENREQKATPKKPACASRSEPTSVEGKNRAYSDEAKRLFIGHFNQPPSWRCQDYIQLGKLRKILPDLSLAEFSRRFTNFLASSVPFYRAQAGSLRFFCSKFDRFMSSNGDGGHRPGDPPSARPKPSPAALSTKGAEILRKAGMTTV
jgi:hypothetical protein